MRPCHLDEFIVTLYALMTVAPILAHGGALIPLFCGMMITGVLLAIGLAIVFTSKTSARWLLGAALCLSALAFLIVFFAYSGSIARYLGLE